MPKISSGSAAPRIPPPAAGIQINFCRNVRCENFGIADDPYERPRLGRLPRGVNFRGVYRYKVVGKGKGVPAILCLSCHQSTRMKSNQAVAEELTRLSRYLVADDGPSCPNQDCANHGRGCKAPGLYRTKGYTRARSARYQCRLCGRTFSAGKSTLRQRKPHENRTIFAHLMNGVAMRRSAKMAEVRPGTLYGKISFLHRQCLRFVAARERRLPEMAFERLYLSSDRQDYYLNWVDAQERRNTRFSAIGTADDASGYVFGMHLNYEPDLHLGDVEQETLDRGDRDRSPPFRRHARIWTIDDLEAAIERSRATKLPAEDGSSLGDEIAHVYETARILNREEYVEWFRALPRQGVQVHQEYTAAGHFQLLRRLLAKTEKIRIFLDQDSDLRTGCFGAFHDRIQQRACDVFFVRIAKDLNIDQRRERVRQSRERFEEIKLANPGVDDHALKLALIAGRLRQMQQHGPWNDQWLEHPLPTMAEPEKMVSMLTDTGDYDLDQAAHLFARASLHAIDRFFMQVRRAISLVERPIGSPTNAYRVWNGKNAYNPLIVQKLLEMYRVVFNYVEVGEDGKTPAMRLGLAEGKIRLEDIIYFNG